MDIHILEHICRNALHILVDRNIRRHIEVSKVREHTCSCHKSMDKQYHIDHIPYHHNNTDILQAVRNHELCTC